MNLIDLCLGEIHFWMLIHESLQQTLLLHFVAGRQSHLLLSLIKHHLLNRGASVSVQIAQFAVLWLHFLRVDLGMVLDRILPPFLIVQFGQRQNDKSSRRANAFVDGPSAIFRLDFLGEVAVKSKGVGSRAKTNRDMRLSKIDQKLLGTSSYSDCKNKREKSRKKRYKI